MTAKKDEWKEMEKFLMKRAGPRKNFYLVTSQELPNDLLRLCEKHSPVVDSFKVCQFFGQLLIIQVAVLYVHPSHKTVQDVFASTPSPGFWTFLDGIAEKVSMAKWPLTAYRGDIGRQGPDSEMDTYFTTWKGGVQIMFHITPWMNSEQHRRSVLNNLSALTSPD